MKSTIKQGLGGFYYIKKVILISIIAFIMMFLAFVLYHKFYFFHSTVISNPKYEKILATLALEAIKSDDVPVAAILVYQYDTQIGVLKDSIIGKGFNTVVKNQNAGEHAEINAISDAIKLLKMENFVLLDRKKLFLYTTFEPCMMCVGACAGNQISNVVFYEEKNAKYLWQKEQKQALKYFLRRKITNKPDFQDSLFRLHPRYGTSTK